MTPGGGAGTLAGMTRATQQTPETSPNGRMGPQEAATTRTLETIKVEARDAAEVELALSLSRTLDRMDEPTRARMLAQTAGQLASILSRLAVRGRARASVAAASVRF